MAFEGLKEKLKDQFEQFGERVVNSRLYTYILERYENFSSPQQRIAKAVSVLILIVLGTYFPMDYFLVSFDHESEFESKRKLIKNIIRSERDLGSLPDIPRPLPSDAIKSNIESQLRELNLMPEQIKQVTINNQPDSKLIPANKLQYGIDITINKINVKQLANVGSKLQIIHPSVKLKDMIVTLNREDSRYLNVDFKMVALNIPEFKIPEPPPPEPPKKKSKKSAKPSEEE